YDVYKGSITTVGTLSTLSSPDDCLVVPRVAQPAGAPGPILSALDNGASPTEGTAIYYLIGYAHEGAGGLTSSVGRRSDGSVRDEPAICP
ncbi:MAG: hypothetical protein V3U83_02470, partial [Acidobacteriota bacterium]